MKALVRTQIQLTEEQARRLRRRAKRHGVSVAEVIRRYVDEGLQKEGTSRGDLYARAARVVGRFRATDGAPSDLSASHDRYLDDAFE